MLFSLQKTTETLEPRFPCDIKQYLKLMHTVYLTHSASSHTHQNRIRQLKYNDYGTLNVRRQRAGLSVERHLALKSMTPSAKVGPS